MLVLGCQASTTRLITMCFGLRHANVSINPWVWWTVFGIMSLVLIAASSDVTLVPGPTYIPLACFLFQSQALETFSVADNKLESLPAGMSNLKSLKQFWGYGNRLQTLPPEVLDMPAIKSESCRGPFVTAAFAYLPCGYRSSFTFGPS